METKTETGSTVTIVETDKGQIQLTPNIVRKYLVSGDGRVTDQEIVMFLNLCKYQRLNPFLREIYLIKYGDNQPATMVTGKETFLKRATNHPKYKGHVTGISDDGKKAWAEVHVDGYSVPIRCEVEYDEYVGTKDEWVSGKKTGRKVPNRMWAEKPRTMLKKVALVQALREAFPDVFGGLYSQEEISSISAPLPEENVHNSETQPTNPAPLQPSELFQKYKIQATEHSKKVAFDKAVDDYLSNSEFGSALADLTEAQFEGLNKHLILVFKANENGGKK
jgi:phage recombination protein Bet